MSTDCPKLFQFKMEIIVNGGDSYFESGQIVSGVVRVDITQFIPSDVTIELRGVSKVHWIELSPNVYGLDAAVVLPPPVVFEQKKSFLQVINVVSGKFNCIPCTCNERVWE